MLSKGKTISSFGSAFLRIILITSILPIVYGGVPPEFPIFVESSSLDEAVRLVENTGFTIKLPVDIPHDLLLTDIRLNGLGPLDLQRPWLEGVSEVLLVFSEESIQENTTIPELLGTGGILVIEKKKTEMDVQIIDSLIEAGGRNGLATVVEVDGKLGYYGEASETLPWRTMLFWIDGETRIEMLASPEHFNKDGCISFAESFTDWSAIKTSTTTTTVIITSTTQTISTLTKTTTVSELKTLTETITKEITTPSTDTAGPSIYAWAIGATVVATALCIALIWKKRC